MSLNGRQESDPSPGTNRRPAARTSVTAIPEGFRLKLDPQHSAISFRQLQGPAELLCKAAHHRHSEPWASVHRLDLARNTGAIVMDQKLKFA